MNDQSPIGVAVVGFGWMGRVHTQAYTRVPHHYPDAPPTTLVAVADDVPGRADAAAARYGFEAATRNWRDLVGDPRIQAVSITAPNFLHREIGSAFVAAGQHIWIEKPVGLSAADAQAVAAAARTDSVASAAARTDRLASAAASTDPPASAAAPTDRLASAADRLASAAAPGDRLASAAAPGDRLASAAASTDPPVSAGFFGNIQTAVGFNYRNAPAVERAREILLAGQIGNVTHARFRLLSDYAAHPDGALSWRFERKTGGNGVLGDLGAHGVDLIRYLLGEIDSLIADTAIFVPTRPRPTAATAGHERGSGEPGPVENEDWFGALLRMASGARVTLEASRVAVAEQNNYGFEIHGTRGALFWDFRRMGELGLSTGGSYQDEPVRTSFAGPHDGEFGAFQPGAGIAMGYDDLKVIEAYRFLRSIADGEPRGATLHDAIRAAEALDAMERSAAAGSWVTLPR